MAINKSVLIRIVFRKINYIGYMVWSEIEVEGK